MQTLNGIGDDLDAELSCAWAIEFGEEDLLPAAEREAAALNPYGCGGANQRGLDVGIGVAFGVLEMGAVWNEAVKSTFHIAGNVGVVALVDQDAGRGVRDVEVAHAGLAGGGADETFNFGGDVAQFGAARGADVD